MNRTKASQRTLAWLASATAEQMTQAKSHKRLRALTKSQAGDQADAIAAWSTLVANPNLGPVWAMAHGCPTVAPEDGYTDTMVALGALSEALATHLVPDEGLLGQLLDLVMHLPNKVTLATQADNTGSAAWQGLAEAIAFADGFEGHLPPLLTSDRARDGEVGLVTTRGVWARLMESYGSVTPIDQCDLDNILRNPSTYRWPELTPCSMLHPDAERLAWNYHQGELHPAVWWWTRNTEPFAGNQSTNDMTTLVWALASVDYHGHVAELREFYRELTTPAHPAPASPVPPATRVVTARATPHVGALSRSSVTQ